MKHYSHLAWGLLAGAMSLLALALPAQVWAHGLADGGAAKSDIDGLFTIIFWIALPIFLLVEGLIIYAVWRFRRRAADEMPDQVAGNRPLELGWTIISFAVVAVIFALTYRFMTTKYEAKAENETGEPDYTVHVTGDSFNWDFEYFRGEDEATGVRTTRTITVPTNRLLLLEISARDVQHSFWVPELAGKVDAIPGQTNTMWLKVDKPGTYKGNCAEFCGTSHYAMIIELEAREPAAFEAWLKEQESAAGQFVPIGTDLESPLPEGDAARGEDIFKQLGCNSCHGAEDGMGPSLSRIREDEQQREGYTPEAYLRESILLPCVYETAGFNCAIMPPDYGTELDAQGLADLMSYLLSDTSGDE
jgi:cytochrome c oxidase subunit 2